MSADSWHTTARFGTAARLEFSTHGTGPAHLTLIAHLARAPLATRCARTTHAAPIARAALAALLCALAPIAAADDDAAPPDTTAASGARNENPRRGVADTVTALPPIQVKGSRGIVPDRVTATGVRLERPTLIRFLPVNAADALVSVPGVDLVKTGPWASRVSLRGLSGDRVLVLVDGVRMNGVRGHGATVSLVPIDRLDGVELLPGASSAQFGSDALGGVINFVTHKNLLEHDRGMALTLAGRAAEPGGMWSQSGRLAFHSALFGAEIAGGGGGLDRLITPSGSVPNSGHREMFATLRLAARAGAALIDAEHARQAAFDAGLPAFNTFAGGTAIYPLQSRDADRIELTVPGGRRRPEARLLMTAQTMRTEFTETTVDSNYVRGRFVATRTTIAGDRVRTRALGVQPALRFAALSGLRLSGEYRHESSSGPRTTEVTVRNASGATTSVGMGMSESMPPAERDVWSGAAFVPLTVRRLRFEPGLRYDAMRSRADSTGLGSTAELDVRESRWSAEAGLARPVGPLEPYLHLATGFRAPNLEERYYSSSIHGGLRLYGNPGLVAEKSQTWEAGLRARELGPFKSGRVSVYRSNVRDLITFVYVGQLYLIPRFQYTNVKRARLEGLEASLQLSAARTTFDVEAALPRAIDEATGKSLTDAGSARVTIDAGVPVGMLPVGRLNLRVRWNDAIRSVVPALERRAFMAGDAELSGALSGTRVVLAMRNLWNADYREPLSFIPEPGRTLALSLRRDFGLALPGGGR